MPADKGKAIVVVPIDTYRKMGAEHIAKDRIVER